MSAPLSKTQYCLADNTAVYVCADREYSFVILYGRNQVLDKLNARNSISHLLLKQSLVCEILLHFQYSLLYLLGVFLFCALLGILLRIWLYLIILEVDCEEVVSEGSPLGA